jgi:hypothetical protein
MRITLLFLTWITVCAAFVGLFLGIDLDLNIFSLSGKWHLRSVSLGTIGHCLHSSLHSELRVYSQEKMRRPHEEGSGGSHQPDMSFSNSFHFPFNRAGGRKLSGF